jgi:uncharacterized protein (DUF4415 family)
MIRKKSKFESGRGYTRKDWDEADIPALTDEQLKQAKPFAEVFPELAAKMEKNLGGRPPLEKPKKAINIRLDQDVIEKFRRTGPGWQSRINEALKAAKVG